MTTYVTSHGMRFPVLATFPSDNVKGANQYMLNNSRAALLTEQTGTLYLVDKHDKGKPVVELLCNECGAPAGKHVQHIDSLKGFGICPNCAPASLAVHGRTRMVHMYGLQGLNYSMPPAVDEIVTFTTPTGTQGLSVHGAEALSHTVTEEGRAFLLETDGTTVCEILAPGHNDRGAIARDLVHAQLSAVKLLAALTGLMASLSAQDEEGLIEHAEQMVAAREAEAFAEGRA